MPIVLINSLQVMAGAALGGLMRYLFTLYLPMPIFLVNILGSLIIGFTYSKLSVSHPQYLPFINTGILGGLTTFSSFSLEVLTALQQGMVLKAAGYAIASLFLGVLACYLGYKAASLV